MLKVQYWKLLTVMLAMLAVGHAQADDNDAATVVRYAKGKTEITPLTKGARVYSNRGYVFDDLPDELSDTSFTFRAGGVYTNCTLSVPADTTVYALVISNSDAVEADLRKDHWTKLTTDVSYQVKSKRSALLVYKKTFQSAGVFETSTRNFSGLIVAAKDLRTTDTPLVETSQVETNKPVSTSSPSNEPATRPALQQASIHALEILKTDTGIMLGQTSEITLTLTPTDRSHEVSLNFGTKAGHEMQLARDDALRFIRLKYPNWLADKAELTFEDKYVNHDGGSIGTALGTLLLSTIEGISIDPAVAITGDISANGKVRAIGGVSAKIKGAIAGKCDLVAIPTDNYNQLVDGVIYNGPSLLTDIQAIGIATLDEAVATVRTDRDSKLHQAIEQFAAVQKADKENPAYLKSKAAQAALADIEQLAPQHYSAKILLQYAHGMLPKTLSTTASMYYTTLAAQPALEMFKERANTRNTHQQLPSGVVRNSLNDLRKLRPIADESVRPLIDAWAKFIDAIAALQERGGTQQAVERQRQALLDEMTKEQADADMMQKTLKEGI